MSEPIRIHARDGRELAAELHTAQSPKGTVVVASAMGVAQGFYRSFAAYLSRRGLCALTFDYRGIGSSRRGALRGETAQLHDWGEQDLSAAFAFMRERFPGLPLQLLAHSVGGQIFGLVPDAPVEAALFVGSQSGAWRHWRGLGRLGMFALWHSLPLFAATLGKIPMRALGQGEDLPGGVGAEWARWGRQRAYIWSYAGPRGGLGFSTFKGRIRAYSISDDSYAPRPAIEALVAMYAQAKTELRPVSPAELSVPAVGHFGFFKERFEQTLWREAADWLLARCGTDLSA